MAENHEIDYITHKYSKPYKYQNIPGHMPTACVNGGCQRKRKQGREVCGDCIKHMEYMYNIENKWNQAADLAMAYHLRDKWKQTTEDLGVAYEALDENQKEAFNESYKCFFKEEYKGNVSNG